LIIRRLQVDPENPELDSGLGRNDETLLSAGDEGLENILIII
jgi:hypothetical protein